MTDKLQEIYEKRRGRVAEAKERVSLQDLETKAKQATGSAAAFIDALNRPGKISVIAEFKRRSPSAGELRPKDNPASVAAAYEEGGASALSILTEPDWFGGALDDIRLARSRSILPILRKDFVFDPYQIVEAKAAGADAVLLIADMIDPVLLSELAAVARQYQLATLVEVFTDEALSAALATGSRLIGVNARNLRTLTMHPDRVERLSARIPSDRLFVAESGIKTPADLERLKKLRVSAVLVGESFLKQPDLSAAVGHLVKAI
jgi:indole-3-glycerol phosphate synthase